MVGTLMSDAGYAGIVESRRLIALAPSNTVKHLVSGGWKISDIIIRKVAYRELIARA
jgi:hypothetical protein